MRAIILALLLAGAGTTAQEFPTKGPATGDPTKNSSEPRQYQGCVIRVNGNIMLADEENHDFRLVGERKFDSYVGQEVQITAHNVNPSDPSSDERSMADAQPRNQPVTLEVEDIQKVSNTCRSPK
jgi:hypothetical protein